MSEIIDVAELDCIYLTYNEPQKEEYWAHIQNMVPWAKRVDGVQGSDAAHKAAAMASETDRFILIDGDNMPDADFFNQQLTIPDELSDCVFRWKARNAINGLMYGNGGMSCWTKDFVMNMKTHEASNGDDDTAVEFCFDPKYIAMHNVYSTTHPNQTPEQAWRAGFREGIKMCLDRGTLVTAHDMQRRLHSNNLENLLIWHTIGRHVENGEWAIFGARHGTYMAMVAEWDYKKVQDFEELDAMWDSVKSIDPEAVSASYSMMLSRQLGMPVPEFNAVQSEFFVHRMQQTHRQKDIMLTEREFNKK